MVLKVLNKKLKGQNFDVDIVFAHGLNGDLLKTWTHHTSNICWPEKWLPVDMPNARVMSFGYNADAAFGNTKATLDDHAKDLMGSMLDRRMTEDEERRPIIFVGHSLGGIVIKQALLWAKLDPRYHPIEESTIGVIFFGTPHRGSQFADYAGVLEKVAKAMVRRPSSKLLGALSNNNEELYQLSTNFQFQLSRLEVVSFYERKPMKIGMIVEKESALLVVPNEESLPVDADHSDICKFEKQDDDVYEKCRLRIERMLKAHFLRSETHDSDKVFWHVPQAINSLYTGREDIAQHLEDAFFPITRTSMKQSLQQRYVISGLGGTGKSEVCLKFAMTHRRRFWSVLWVDGSSKNAAEKDFIDFANRCGEDSKDFEKAIRWLSNVNRNWLLIIDNADDINFDYSRYFPACDRGCILITTRNPECSVLQTVGHESLAQLDLADASNLLLKAAGSDDRDAAEMVVQVLGLHTLAIIQAGAVVKQKLCSLLEYPLRFSQQRDFLLKYHSKQAQSPYGSVYATFEVSASMLKASVTPEAKDALALLPVLAFMHFERIPGIVFEGATLEIERIRQQREEEINDNLFTVSKWHVDKLPNCMYQGSSTTEIQFSLRRAFNQLTAFSLITIVGEAGNVSISMHPLAHAWAKDRLTRSEQEQSWLTTGSIFAMSIPYKRHNPIFQKLQHHVHAFNVHQSKVDIQAGQSLGVLQILAKLGWLLLCNQKHSHATVIFQNILGISDVEDSHVSRSLLKINIHIAECETALGRYLNAIWKLEQVVEIRKTTLDSTHPSRLASQHALAGAYMGNGEHKRAVTILEQVVEIRKTTLDSTHPDRLASQHELARAYIGNGEHKRAVKILEQVVEIWKTTLDSTHPNRLASQHALAGAYMGNGEHKRAVTILEQVVEICKTTLDSTHPDRLASQHALAQAYMGNGEHKRAVTILEQVVEICKTTLDSTHPDRLASQHELARAYRGNGEHKRAVKILEQVVEIWKTTLDPTHPSRLASQHELAQAYIGNGEHKRAVTILEQVVEIWKTALDSTHPNRLASQHALAGAYMGNGEHKRAVTILEQVVEIRKTTLDPTHPSRLASQHALAGAYMGNGEHKRAATILEQVVEIRKTSLDSTHPDRLTSQHELAGAYMRNGEHKRAATILEQVVEIWKTTLDPTHPNRLTSQHALARAYMGNGEHKRAATILEQVVEIRKTSLDSTHPDRLASQHALAGAYYLSGNYLEALQNASEVQEIKANLDYGPTVQLLEHIKETMKSQWKKPAHSREKREDNPN